MESKSTGAWHAFYGGLVLVFLLVFFIFSGAASSASTPTMEHGWMAAVAVIAFALFPVTILFWILAAANVRAIRRNYEDHRMKPLLMELEEQKEKERVLRERLVVLLYELFGEFATRFAPHFIRTVLEHPESDGNRRNFWIVIAFVSAMINQVRSLGDEERAQSLMEEFSRRFLESPQSAFGEGRKLLGDTKLVLGVLLSARAVPVEYLGAARSTRLLDYVVKF